MTRALCWGILGFSLAGAAGALAASRTSGEGNCAQILHDLKLPRKLKSRGKPRRARWELVDRVLTDVRQAVEKEGCEFRFDQLFVGDGRHTLYMPVTNNLVRTVPEATLLGLALFDGSGRRIGTYAGRIQFQRTGGLYARKSYTLYYFQYRNLRGKIESTGNRLLGDDFLVRWEDLQDRVAIRSGAAQ